MPKSKRHDDALEKAYDTLRQCHLNGDKEGAHCNADQALCDFLRALGYNNLVEQFERLEKWYA